MDSLAKAADRCRGVLTNQRITAQGPGTILTDIRTMLEFIGAGGMASLARQQITAQGPGTILDIQMVIDFIGTGRPGCRQPG